MPRGIWIFMTSFTGHTKLPTSKLACYRFIEFRVPPLVSLARPDQMMLQALYGPWARPSSTLLQSIKFPPTNSSLAWLCPPFLIHSHDENMLEKPSEDAQKHCPIYSSAKESLITQGRGSWEPGAHLPSTDSLYPGIHGAAH